MDNQKRFEIIKNNTQEVLTDDDLKLLLESKANPKAYIGMSTTGPFHMAYLIPLGKMIEWEAAGIKNTILIADIHAALDDQKCGWDMLDMRAEYYQKCIEKAFPWENRPKFIKGSDFQTEKKYVLDMLKLSTLTTVTRSTRAASEVTRMKNPKVSELIYPIMQSIDEEYLDVDIQLGGIDQRHILAYAREFMPKLGYEPRVEIMTPLIASLKGPGTKMSASIPSSHVKVYDSEEQVDGKIKNAYCPVGDVTDNAIIQLARYLIFPANGKLMILRDEKFGGDKEYLGYDELEADFIAKKLHPSDLKRAVAQSLKVTFKDAREYFESNSDIITRLGEEFKS